MNIFYVIIGKNRENERGGFYVVLGRLFRGENRNDSLIKVY